MAGNANISDFKTDSNSSIRPKLASTRRHERHDSDSITSGITMLSSVSSCLHKCFQEKFGQGIFAVARASAIASLHVKNKDIIPVSLLEISASGNYKSQLSNACLELFPKKTIELGSDFTMHVLVQKFGSDGKGLTGKTALVNDLSLLFRSKAQRTRERLIAGLAEILSENQYIYMERQANFSFTARINIIANITPEIYDEQQDLFAKSTFGERLLPIFKPLDLDEQENFALESVERFKMSYNGSPINLKPRTIKITKEQKQDIVNIAKDLRLRLLSPSLSRVHDKVYSLLCGHALLNGRDYLHQDDFDFITKLKPYFSGDAAIDQYNILSRHINGVSTRDIVRQLYGLTPIETKDNDKSKNKPYEAKLRHVQRTISSLKLRGVIPKK